MTLLDKTNIAVAGNRRPILLLYRFKIKYKYIIAEVGVDFEW